MKALVGGAHPTLKAQQAVLSDEDDGEDDEAAN